MNKAINILEVMVVTTVLGPWFSEMLVRCVWRLTTTIPRVPSEPPSRNKARSATDLSER